jgi:hypothetical protein
MLKFVVQALDQKGHWLDHQAAWNFKEATQIEASLMEEDSIRDSQTPQRQTRIVAADQANGLYSL